MKDKILIGIFWIALITIGSLSTLAYQDWDYNNNYEKNLNGLYVHNSKNISTTMEYAYSRESKGDWVCINVAYDMTPEEAYSTCVHECSHKAFSEIYAESCEKEPDKCMEWLNE